MSADAAPPHAERYHGLGDGSLIAGLVIPVICMATSIGFLGLFWFLIAGVAALVGAVAWTVALVRNRRRGQSLFTRKQRLLAFVVTMLCVTPAFVLVTLVLSGVVAW